MKLYNAEFSGNCYKVRLLLSMLNIDYEIIPIDIQQREQKTSEYLKKNPLGEIPVLEDGGLILRDSQAILVYLARKYGTDEWFPSNPEEMAQVMQWLSTACNEIARGLMDARAHFKLNLDLDIDKAHERSKNILTIIDNHLKDNEWLALDHVTIADIACFPYIALANEGKVSLEPYLNVQKWVENTKQLPSFIPMPGILA